MIGALQSSKNYEFIEKKDFSGVGSVGFNNLKGDTERYLLILQINATASAGQYISFQPNGQSAWSGASYSFTGGGNFNSINEAASGSLNLAKVPNSSSNISIAGFLAIDFRAGITFRSGVGQFVATGGAGTGTIICGLNGYGVSGMTSLQISGGGNISGSIELYRMIP